MRATSLAMTRITRQRCGSSTSSSFSTASAYPTLVASGAR